MTVADLIHVLTQACENADVSIDDVEVRLAHQAHWPFEYEIDSGPDITVVEVQNDAYERYDKILYLPEGSQLGYLPHEAAVSLGWKEDQEA